MWNFLLQCESGFCRNFTVLWIFKDILEYLLEFLVILVKWNQVQKSFSVFGWHENAITQKNIFDRSTYDCVCVYVKLMHEHLLSWILCNILFIRISTIILWLLFYESNFPSSCLNFSSFSPFLINIFLSSWKKRREKIFSSCHVEKYKNMKNAWNKCKFFFPFWISYHRHQLVVCYTDARVKFLHKLML